jgi:MSHA biogenesis protein MshG
MFRILFRSGLPIVKSLEVLGRTIRNSQVRREIEDMTAGFRRGKELLIPPDNRQYFPAQALQMLKIGLESGSLEQMLAEVGRHYSREVLYRSRQLTSVLEPILTLVVGAFVLLLALAIFLPMWSLIRVFHP